MATCSVGPSAVTGEPCGKPAVTSFTARDGETIFHECAEHCVQIAGSAGDQVGDIVPVQRHGKVYHGQVVRVTRSGRVFAEVTYGNGATRVVEV